MVAVAKRDDVVIAAESSRHQDRKIVGLGAGIDEVADFEIAWHFCGELARVFGNIRMQLDGRGVLECLALEIGRSHNIWMTMADADCGNTRDAIQITPAFFVENILTFALNDRQRLLVVMKRRWVEELPPKGE